MGLLLHQPLLRLRMGHMSLFHIIMKAKLSCRSSQFPWKMLEITPAMSQIMLVAPQIGRRLSFKVCCDVNELRHETIWFVNIFLGRKWPKAEVRCEVEELFYTKLKSFKSLWPKFDANWHTEKPFCACSSETLRYFQSLNGMLAFTANG